MSELIFYVAFEAGDGSGKGVEGEGEIVGFVGERFAEGIFDISNRFIDDLAPISFRFHKSCPGDV